MDLNLKDKLAIVTGAARGLGAALCEALAAEGVNVVINYRRNPSLAETLARRLEADHAVRALPIRADIACEPDVLAMFDDIDRTLGPADILVNNAAVCPTGPVAETTQQTFNDTLQTNLTGAFLCCREFAKRLIAANRLGRIVNISSQAAFRGSTTGHAPYDASKGALVSLTVSLARELAGHGIHVNAVAPGMIHTEMTDAVLSANKQKYLDRIPLGRIATAGEIARVVAFLAGSGSDYITGATIDASGGLAMR